MTMKRLLLVLILLHGCLLTPLLAVDIRVGDQASFDRLDTDLKAALAASPERIDVYLAPGFYYYRDKHLYLKDLQAEKTLIALHGEGVTLYPRMGREAGFSPFSSYYTRRDSRPELIRRKDPVKMAGFLVKVLDREKKICRLKVDEELLPEAAKDGYIYLTEWYRGKGYDFTITSSTAYDQAFTYGRNIFSEISDVVDEVFNLYITRPDYTQPLFAQYCDGRRVKRSGWLSQWGSKELADKGYTAMRILQSYYGRDIVLRQARRVEGVPVSFSGTLSVGSRGNAVRTIQQQLNAISVNFPLIPKLAVDGIFGPKTRQSVRTFQQIFRLPETGTVDFSTWYRISDIYVAVRKLAENT